MTCFDAGYCDDRESFRSLAAAAGFDLDARPILARGPQDETLTIDTARRGATRARLGLIVLSGVHGVEGPAGSALQRDWLAQDLRVLIQGAATLADAYRAMFGAPSLRR
jgi:octopine/nopaline transport system ATP-binding protein